MIKKEDARILWNEEFIEGEFFITELIVAEFKQNVPSCEWPLYLNKKYSNDLGNSGIWWNKYTLSWILSEFGFRMRFKNTKIAHKAFKEFMKIEEWNEEIRECDIKLNMIFWE